MTTPKLEKDVNARLVSRIDCEAREEREREAREESEARYVALLTELGRVAAGISTTKSAQSGGIPRLVPCVQYACVQPGTGEAARAEAGAGRDLARL